MPQLSVRRIVLVVSIVAAFASIAALVVGGDGIRWIVACVFAVSILSFFCALVMGRGGEPGPSPEQLTRDRMDEMRAALAQQGIAISDPQRPASPPPPAASAAPETPAAETAPHVVPSGPGPATRFGDLELAAARGEVERLRKELESARHAESLAVDESSSQAAQVAARRADVDRLTAELAAVQAEVEEERARASGLERRATEADERRDELARAVKALETEREGAAAKVRTADTARAALEKEVQTSAAARAAVETRLTDLGRETEALRVKLAAAEKSAPAPAPASAGHDAAREATLRKEEAAEIERLRAGWAVAHAELEAVAKSAVAGRIVAEKDAQTSAAARAAIETRVSELERESEALRGKLAAAEKAAAAAVAAGNDAAREAAQRKDQAAEFERLSVEWTAARAELEAVAKSAVAARVVAEKDTQAWSAARKRDAVLAAEQTAEIASLRKSLDAARAEVDTATKALAVARGRSDEMEALRLASSKAESFAKENESLRGRVEALAREAVKLVARAEAAEAERASFARSSAEELSELQLRLTAAEAESAHSERTRAAQAEELESLRSRTGRAASPARADDRRDAEIAALKARATAAEDAVRAAMRELGVDPSRWPLTAASVLRATSPLTLYALGEDTPGWRPGEGEDTLAAAVLHLRRQADERLRQLQKAQTQMDRTTRP